MTTAPLRRIPNPQGVALVVGHRETSQGVRVPGDVAEGDPRTEWEFNHQLVAQVQSLLASQGARVAVFHHPPGGYRASVRDHTVRAINRWDPALVVSFHSNAAPHPLRTNRSSALYVSPRGKTLATALSKAASEAIGIKDGGPVFQDRSWNGPAKFNSEGRQVPGGPLLYILTDTDAPASILESHYMSQIKDGHPAPVKGHDRAVQALQDLSLATALATTLLGLLAP